MRQSSLFIHLVGAVLVLGCTEAPKDTGADMTTTTASSSGTEDAPTSSGTTAPTPDSGIGNAECDPWLQDCPAGLKCMAYAMEGEGHFTGTKCTPVAENPATAGDPCHVEGGWWTGVDNCDYGHACWHINHETNEGVCVPMCEGSVDAYSCPSEGEICVFWVKGLSHVCLETCDPLLQDCPAAQSCLPEWGGGAGDWVCVPEYSGDEGQAFDPCAYNNVCDPGLLCWDATEAVECAGSEYCCLPLCDLDNPQCGGQGSECQSFYDVIEGEAPPAYASVGLCSLPG